MATDFFQRQTAARRSTGWLLIMFSLATIAVVVSIMTVTAFAIAASTTDAAGSAGARSSLTSEPFPWQIPALAGAATLVLIVLGSLFKTMQLRAGGGSFVAESMGGVRIYPNSTDPLARRLLNIVEEMSIASGVAVPPVFLLGEEQGINAFAAGYSSGDAALGVTRGCAEKLTRDELQGVLAHEFSHILNGDMKIGIRVMGVLYGILLLGLVGQMVLRTMLWSGGHGSRRDSDSGKLYAALMAISLALIVLGFVGTFIGNLIKAAISRQRERLADASGVQFTRNPAGLAGALKRIGGEAMGSQLHAANAAEISHVLFAEGVWKSMAGLWSSHPPLDERIRELDPGWDGKYPAPGAAAPEVARELRSSHAYQSHSQFSGLAPAASHPRQLPQSARVDATIQNEVPVNLVDHAIEHVGNPTMAHVDYAAALRPLIPEAVINAAREPYAARSIVFCLLLHKNSDVRSRQLQLLSQLVPPNIVTFTQKLIPYVDDLDVRVRLPLADIAIPALASMSRSQYESFVSVFEKLVWADERLDLFEWVLAQLVTSQLRPHFERIAGKTVRYKSLAPLAKQCSVVLSAVAHGGNPNEVAALSFSIAAKRFPTLGLALLPREKASLNELRHALAELAHATLVNRAQLVDACADAIAADGHATIEEVETLRGVSALLGCPMPPLLVKS
jgi:Zn-dependent protease with chaperone function